MTNLIVKDFEKLRDYQKRQCGFLPTDFCKQPQSMLLMFPTARRCSPSAAAINE
jgi:hypothetical protein